QCAAFALSTFVPGGDCATASCIDQCLAYPGSPTSDYNGDGKVDLKDFAEFQRCFGANPEVDCLCLFDINEDGEITIDPDYLNFESDLLGPQALLECKPYQGYGVCDHDN